MKTLTAQRYDETEIVDDSEPERVQLRNTSKASADKWSGTQKLGHAHATGLQSSTRAFSTTVIEISDSESCSSFTENTGINLSLPPSSFSPESRKNALDISRFAFKSYAPRKRPATPPRSPKSAEKPALYQRPIPKKRRLPLDLLPSEVAKISRCVCCNVSWTTRKTAVQKTAHMQTCARKHFYDDETVRILVRKEAENTQLPKNTQGKQQEIPKPSTFLEDLVHTAGPKKRSKAQPPQTVLPSGSGTWENILAKAQAILVAPTPDETRPDSSSTSDCQMRPTQSFSESALGKLQDKRRQALLREGYNEPPVTQDFSESKLGRLQSPSTYFLADEAERDDMGSGHWDTSASPSRSQNSPSRSSPPVFLDRTGHPDVLTPEAQRTTNELTLIHMPKKSPKRTSRTKNHDLSSDAENLPTEGTLTKRRDPSKKPLAKRKKTSATFGNEWEAFMKQQIQADHDLCLRVLRYEPIDFNIFMKFAMVYAPSTSSGKLKLQLQKFLDIQAIHFYDNNKRWVR